MTTITLPRATVEQALEALRLAYEGRCWLDTVPDAMDALRAALAQQAEPLTQEEAATLVVQDNRMRGEFSAAMELIRRTERAHNIKE